jgi:hypothetical protein
MRGSAEIFFTLLLSFQKVGTGARFTPSPAHADYFRSRSSLVIAKWNGFVFCDPPPRDWSRRAKGDQTETAFGLAALADPAILGNDGQNSEYGKGTGLHLSALRFGLRDRLPTLAGTKPR